MNQPRVVHIVEPTSEGVGRYLSGIVRQLIAAGMRVTVICPWRKNSAFRENLTRLGVEVVRCDMAPGIHPWRDMKSLFLLCRLLRGQDVDVIHCHSSKAGAIGRVAAFLIGKRPVAYTPHAYAFLARPRRFRWAISLSVEWLLARITDAFIAVSDSERTLTINKLHVGAGKVVAATNGLGELPSVKPSKQSVHSPNAHPVRIGFLGRLEPQKRPQLILRAAALLKHRGVDFRLSIGGEGTLLEECKRIVSELNLEGEVDFQGYIHDPPGFLETLDIFAATSQYEGLPYTLLDAMAYELPIVAIDVVGVNDVVMDGSTGFLVPDDDLESFSQQLARLVEAPSLRTELGQAGRHRVCHHFQQQQQVRVLLDTYEAMTCASRRQRMMKA